MKVSVVIPVYNEEKYLKACLESIVNQEEKPDEIIVVDNNSTDSSMAIAEQYPVRIVHEKQQGMTPARNRGFDEAKYEIIARTDADTIVSRDWVKRIKKALSSPQTVAVSGRAYFYGLPNFIKEAYWPSNTFIRLLQHDWMFGPNMALKKSAWEKVRSSICLNDKDVHEDIDLGIHLGVIGKIKYDEKLVVISSIRRFKKIQPYFEYPYRYIKTINIHRKYIAQRQAVYLKKQIAAKTNLLKKPLQQLTNIEL